MILFVPKGVGVIVTVWTTFQLSGVKVSVTKLNEPDPSRERFNVTTPMGLLFKEMS